MNSEILHHLLIKGKFEVWCRPGHSAGMLNITNRPSKATCANCLTRYRLSMSERKRRFRVSHTLRPSKFNPE